MIDILLLPFIVVVAGVKLKILKANHNKATEHGYIMVVVAGVKLKILKANHNASSGAFSVPSVVVAGVKLKILKANHNTEASGLAQSRNHGCLYHEAPGLDRCSQLPFHRI